MAYHHDNLIPLAVGKQKNISYLNYYLGNEVLLLPIYNDEHDKVAQEILAQFYPQRKIVPILVNALYSYGGMIHCVTQQQPII